MFFNPPPFKTRSDLAGLKVTVMGLGLNGGGLATARFFAASGALVTVTDKKTAEELAPSVAALGDFEHPLVLARTSFPISKRGHRSEKPRR